VHTLQSPINLLFITPVTINFRDPQRQFSIKSLPDEKFIPLRKFLLSEKFKRVYFVHKLQNGLDEFLSQILSEVDLVYCNSLPNDCRLF